MSAVIITKKDLEKFGEKLLKKVFDMFQHKALFEGFEEIKKERNNFLKNFNDYKTNLNFFRDNLDKIYDVISKLNLNKETTDKLYLETKAFLNIYGVFHSDYHYLDKSI